MVQNKNIKNHDIIVFGLEHYNPLGVLRSLGQEGIYPTLITLKGRWPISEKSIYVKELHNVQTFDEGLELIQKKFGNAKPDELPIIITCDDKTMQFLDVQYESLADKFIIFNANGENGRITKYMDKFEILKAAELNGLKILPTQIVDRGVIPQDLEYPIITKSISPNVGGWKSDVYICRSEEELKTASLKIKSPKVLIQKYIEKKNEYCIDGFSVNQGRDTTFTIAATYNYLIPGYYSPFMTLENLNKPDLEAGMRKLIEYIGYEGIWCIEFLIDQDDNYYFTEVNFRNSGWSYASTKAGMNMPVLWIESILNGKIDYEKAYSKIPEGFTAMVEPIDYQKRVIEGNTSFGEWLMDFKKADCGFYYDEVDTEPFFEMVRNWEHLN